MTLTKTSNNSESGGMVGFNQRSTETWDGEINGKRFTVLLDSCEAPRWSGDDMDEDERIEVMNELAERSGL